MSNRLAQIGIALAFVGAATAAVAFSAPAPDLTGSGLTVLADVPAAADSRHYTIYRGAAGAPAPTTLPATPGFEVWAPLGPVAGARYSVTLRELPPAPPAPTPGPVRPAFKPTTQPHRTAYPNGIASFNHTAAQVVRDAYVKGQSRNIVCQNFAGDLLIDNVVSVDAMGPGQFDGQGIYLDDVRGTATIQNSYLGYNGRSRLPGAWSPTQYAHHVYHNNTTGKSGRLVVRGNIFAKSAADAIEARSLAGSEVAGNVFLDDGMALCVIMGGADFHDNLVYGGDYWWDGNGWTGNTALKSYWPIACRNNVILSRPHQGDVPQSTAHPATKAWPQYGINLGGTWSHDNPPWTAPPGFPQIPLYMTGSGNLISPSWPGGIWYSSGVQEKAEKKVQGWALTADGPDYDYTPVLSDIEAEHISVPDAITKLRADLLSKLAAAPNN